MNYFVRFVCLLLLATSLGCGSSQKMSGTSGMNKLTPEEKREGWQLLFDGKTTSGWHTYGRSSVGAAWKIAEGVLYCDTARVNGKRVGAGDLTTDQSFENFDLKLEWKIAPGGNSGIIFLINEDTAKYRATYATGPEMQIIDNNGHADARIVKHRAGDLYDLIASSRETVKPLDEWNLAEIKMDHGRLDLFLNGVNVVSTTMWDDNWKSLVAASKFKNWNGFAQYHRGRIALQDHGNQVYFRNIRIKEL